MTNLSVVSERIGKIDEKEAGVGPFLKL